jgi:hypothetical protein
MDEGGILQIAEDNALLKSVGNWGVISEEKNEVMAV